MSSLESNRHRQNCISRNVLRWTSLPIILFAPRATEHRVTMPRARNQAVLQKCSYKQATIKWPWSSVESVLLLVQQISVLLLVTLVDLAFFTLRVRISHDELQLNSHSNKSVRSMPHLRGLLVRRGQWGVLGLLVLQRLWGVILGMKIRCWSCRQYKALD